MMDLDYRKKISVVIPAYNNPSYTRKTLQSVVAQTYRPIEIIISDDNSPINLESLYLDIKNNYADIEIKYFRNATNLRTYWNVYKAISYASGEYLVLMPHDDWFIDNDFLMEATAAIESHDGIYAAIGNSVIENSCQPFMDVNFHNWLVINGMNFIKPENTFGLWGKAHPAYSAIVLDRLKLLELNYFDVHINIADATKMGIEPDEAFGSLIVLGLAGNISICGKICSIRGNPSDSYSKTEFWTKTANEAVFVQLFNLYCNTSNPESKSLIEKIITKQCRDFRRINFKIIEYFRGHRVKVGKILVAGFIRWLISRPRFFLGYSSRKIRAVLAGL